MTIAKIGFVKAVSPYTGEVITEPVAPKTITPIREPSIGFVKAVSPYTGEVITEPIIPTPSQPLEGVYVPPTHVAITPVEPTTYVRIAGEPTPTWEKVTDIPESARVAHLFARAPIAPGELYKRVTPSGTEYMLRSWQEYQVKEREREAEKIMELATPRERRGLQLATAVGGPYGIRYLGALAVRDVKTAREYEKRTLIAAKERGPIGFGLGAITGTPTGVITTSIAAGGLFGAGVGYVAGIGTVGKAVVTVGGLGLGGVYAWQKGIAIGTAIRKKEYARLGEIGIRTAIELPSAAWGFRKGFEATYKYPGKELGLKWGEDIYQPKRTEVETKGIGKLDLATGKVTYRGLARGEDIIGFKGVSKEVKIHPPKGRISTWGMGEDVGFRDVIGDMPDIEGARIGLTSMVGGKGDIFGVGWDISVPKTETVSVSRGFAEMYRVTPKKFLGIEYGVKKEYFPTFRTGMGEMVGEGVVVKEWKLPSGREMTATLQKSRITGMGITPEGFGFYKGTGEFVLGAPVISVGGGGRKMWGISKKPSGFDIGSGAGIFKMPEWAKVGAGFGAVAGIGSLGAVAGGRAAMAATFAPPTAKSQLKEMLGSLEREGYITKRKVKQDVGLDVGQKLKQGLGLKVGQRMRLDLASMYKQMGKLDLATELRQMQEVGQRQRLDIDQRVGQRVRLDLGLKTPTVPELGIPTRITTMPPQIFFFGPRFPKKRGRRGRKVVISGVRPYRYTPTLLGIERMPRLKKIPKAEVGIQAVGIRAPVQPKAQLQFLGQRFDISPRGLERPRKRKKGKRKSLFGGVDNIFKRLGI